MRRSRPKKVVATLTVSIVSLQPRAAAKMCVSLAKQEGQMSELEFEFQPPQAQR